MNHSAPELAEDDWWTAENYRIIMNTMAKLRSRTLLSDHHGYAFDSALGDVEMCWRRLLSSKLQPCHLLLSPRSRPANLIAADPNADNAAAVPMQLPMKYEALKKDEGNDVTLPGVGSSTQRAPRYRMPPPMRSVWREAIIRSPAIASFVANCVASYSTTATHQHLDASQVHSSSGAVEPTCRKRSLEKALRIASRKVARVEEQDGVCGSISDAELVEAFGDSSRSCEVLVLPPSSGDLEELGDLLRTAEPASLRDVRGPHNVAVIILNNGRRLPLIDVQAWRRTQNVTLVPHINAPGVLRLPDGQEFPFSRLRSVVHQ